MELTIFPKSKPHPSQDQKREESKKCLYGEVVEIQDEDNLYDIITQNAWSPSIFDGRRLSENFKYADFLALDVDEDLSLSEAEKRCTQITMGCLIAPSPSYSPTNEKFRMVFPLSERISTDAKFKATWQHLIEIFPEADPLCKDPARFYFGSKPENTVYVEGDFLRPVTPKPVPPQLLETSLLSTEDFDDKDVLEILYGEVPKKIPESVDFFLRNAESGLSGQWNSALNACIYTLGLQGLTFDKIYATIERVAPEPLDSKDEYVLKRAFEHGKEKRTESR